MSLALFKNRLRHTNRHNEIQLQLFLDDARIKNFTSCFKDKRFLQFFFKRLKFNETNRYQHDFPYLSLCGQERNFIRCDDVPIVYTETLPIAGTVRAQPPKSAQILIVNHFQLLADSDSYSLSYAHAGSELLVPFEPDKIFMAPDTGRVYHPGKEQYGLIGLIRSKLAIEFSTHFEFGNGERGSPTHFTWNNVRHELDNRWLAGIKLAPGREKL